MQELPNKLEKINGLSLDQNSNKSYNNSFFTDYDKETNKSNSTYSNGSIQSNNSFAIKDFSDLQYNKMSDNHEDEVRVSRISKYKNIFFSGFTKFCECTKDIVGLNYNLNQNEVESFNKLDFECSELFDSSNNNHELMLKNLIDSRRKISYIDLGFQVSLLIN